MEPASCVPMVLIVDDSEDHLFAMSTSLQDLGAKIVTARSGEEALAYMLRDNFAVILLDITMPDMDGFETAGLMRGNKRTATVPIIFVTGSLGEQGKFRGYASGAVDYLLKPLEPAILRSKVKVFIDLFMQSQELEILRELRTAQKMLEERNEELLDFISAAYHDLREPIRQLATCCDFLTEPHQGEPETIEIISALSKALLAQNDRLQVYARILTEQQRFQQLQLGSLVEEVVDHLRTEIERSEGRVDIGPLPPIVGDVSQVRLLFQLLLENALQYTRPGVPPHVHIDAASDHQWHTICVRDNGRGFDETYLSRILRPFKRLVTKSEVQGIGLGLPLAKRIVDAHGGQLRASSTLDQGSQFYIRFPTG